MEIIETLPLPNGLVLTVADLSKSIAQTTVKVELSFQIKMKALESFFNSKEDYLQLTSIFGDELTYERKMERSFVASDKEASVRDELVETFKSNSLHYLSNANFAQKMALSLLRDIKQNPFKYRIAHNP